MINIMIVPLNQDDLLTSFNYQWFFEVLIYRSNHPKTNPRNLKILQYSPKIAGQWTFTSPLPMVSYGAPLTRQRPAPGPRWMALITSGASLRWSRSMRPSACERFPAVTKSSWGSSWWVFRRLYPPVMTHIAMENGHWNCGFSHRQMVIFCSYVKLPEGKACSKIHERCMKNVKPSISETWRNLWKFIIRQESECRS